MSSEGKFAAVTGAGSGVGKRSALALLADGYSVALAGRRADALQSTVDEAGEAGARALAIPTDVADPSRVEAFFAKIKETLRPARPAVQQRRRQCARRAVRGPDLRAVAARGRRQPDRLVPVRPGRVPDDEGAGPRGGRIINNGSISAHVPRPDSAPYTSTKHAITGLTRRPSLDGRKYDIACGQIDIGNAATEMAARMADGRAAGRRRDRGRAADGRGACRPRGRPHGEPAAGRQRPVHDGDGHQDAVRRPRLSRGLTARRAD